MLNPEFNYIWLDFETTWLEIEKDVPIQIGIVQIDCNLNILEEFQSLIKPSKQTDNLKDIVGFITWLNIDSLQSAPDLEEVNEKIKHFFNKKTIIIWHNIDFDIDFLKKFFPDLEFYDRIDTYSLSQKLIHYAPSYALEVLIEHLKTDSFFKKYTNNANRQNEKNFHNALEDTKYWLNLFDLLFQHLQDISKKYPDFNQIVKQHTLLGPIIDSLKTIEQKHTIEIPKLKKILAPNTKISTNKESKINLDDMKSMERFFIWNYNIKEFLLDIGTNKQIILSFSNLQ
jgi:DNA polymerase-3 subunit epsilon